MCTEYTESIATCPMLNTLNNIIVQLIFPSSCLGCHTSGTPLCINCKKLIKRNAKFSCYLCGISTENGTTCEDHLKSSKRLNGLIIAAHYNGNPLLKKAIRQFKYAHQKELSSALGTLLHEVFMKHDIPHQNITMVPIPLHESRLKERGFNQSELLTKQLIEITLHPKISTKRLLNRSVNTSPQAQCKDRRTRMRNLHEAFTCTSTLDPNTTYFLIDDVCTTGSTLEECCKTLRQNGAKQVWGLVLARN